MGPTSCRLWVLSTFEVGRISLTSHPPVVAFGRLQPRQLHPPLKRPSVWTYITAPSPLGHPLPPRLLFAFSQHPSLKIGSKGMSHSAVPFQSTQLMSFQSPYLLASTVSVRSRGISPHHLPRLPPSCSTVHFDPVSPVIQISQWMGIGPISRSTAVHLCTRPTVR